MMWRAPFAIHAWPTSILIAGNGIVQATYGPFVDRQAQNDLRTLTSPKPVPRSDGRPGPGPVFQNQLPGCEANTVRDLRGILPYKCANCRASLRAGRTGGGA